MHIGHYAFGLNDPGGVRSYVLSLASAQRQDGARVHLFDHIDRRAAGGPAGQEVRWISGPADLVRACGDLRLDVLHVHSGWPHDLLSELPGTAVVRTLHGHAPYCPSASRFLAWQGRPCPRSYDPLGCLAGHFFSHCGSLRPTQLLQAFRGHEAERAAVRRLPTVVVSDFQRRELLRGGHPGTDLHVLLLPAWGGAGADLAPPGGEARFLFLGRLVPAKGLAWLLRALARIRVPLHLDIAGDGPRAGALQHLAVELGLSGRVTFHGWVDAPRAKALLHQARALVVPSLWHEPSGTVAVEAAAAGRAVIASRVGGLPEYVVDWVTGLLVAPGDADGLAEALVRLAVDYDLAASLGHRARQRVGDTFSAERRLAGVAAVYAAARGRLGAVTAG